MKIRLGYVAISLSLNITASRTLTYTNFERLGEAAYSKIDQIIRENFASLKEILHYNYQNGIHFYRMSHKLIPLATHENVKFDYITPYQKEWQEIGDLIKKYDIRVDIHPDQFCVLNSNKKKVKKNTLEILKYTFNIFKAMDINGKAILHVGGAYDDKEKALKRFIKNFKQLPKDIQDIIVLENDDKIYGVKDVISLCETLDIPMVLDYHHFKCHNEGEDINDYLPRIIKSWNKTGLSPKMHFSSAKNKREIRSHSEYINVLDFIEFLNILKPYNTDIDVMLECKGKDEALFRLVRLLKHYTNFKFLSDGIIEINH